MEDAGVVLVRHTQLMYTSSSEELSSEKSSSAQSLTDSVLSKTTERQRRFMALLQPLLPNLERFAWALVRRSPAQADAREIASDLVAETIACAYEQFDRLRQPEALLSFLFTIATRLHRKQREKALRFVRLAGDNAERGTNESERWLDATAQKHYHHRHRAADNTADSTHDVHALYAALDRLPDKQREAIILFEIMGFSMKEIVEVQGGTIIAMKVRISRARAALAAMLKDQYSEQ